MKKTIKTICLFLCLILTVSSLSVGFAASVDDFGYNFTYYNQYLINIGSFSGEPDKDGIVVVPDEIDGYKVAGIDKNAFIGNTKIKTLVVPDGCEIDPEAFVDCELIPTVVEKSDFNGGYLVDGKNEFVLKGTTLVTCNSRGTVSNIPSKVTAIGPRAFAGNKKIVRVNLPKNLSSIGAEAFKGCEKLEEVVTPNENASISIGKDAFAGTAYIKSTDTSLKLLGATLVKYIGKTKVLYLPTFIKSIGSKAFDGSKTEKVIISPKATKFAKDFAEKEIVKDEQKFVLPCVVVDSAAHKACINEAIDFELVGIPGDANADGEVTSADARKVLRVAAKVEKNPFDDAMTLVLDLDRDKNIRASDARTALRIAARLDKYGDREKGKNPVTIYGVMDMIYKATDAVSTYGPQYSKYAYQDITEEKCNKITIKNAMKDGLTSKSKAQTKTFKAKTSDSKINMSAYSLWDIDSVGAWNFKDTGDELVMSMSIYSEKYNMGDTREPNAVKLCSQFENVESLSKRITSVKALKDVKFNVSYSGATITVKIDKATNKLSGLESAVKYTFDISGKSAGTNVRESAFSNKNASIVRVDKVVYSNFDWNAV